MLPCPCLCPRARVLTQRPVERQDSCRKDVRGVTKKFREGEGRDFEFPRDRVALEKRGERQKDERVAALWGTKVADDDDDDERDMESASVIARERRGDTR